MTDTVDTTVEEENEFWADNEVMDLSPIRDHTFAVAVATGNPQLVKFLCTTLHGPYNFVEMVQEVGTMWHEHQHHAKVVIMSKDPKEKVKALDENTIDYIEAHYSNIIMDEFLTGDDKEFTCVAGTVEEE